MPAPHSRIEEALSSPRDFDGLFDSSDLANLAERLEEALQGGAAELNNLARKLSLLSTTQAGVLQLSGEVVARREVPLRLAYQAGVVGFAQLVAAQAAVKRAPDRVQDIARSTPLAPYIAELHKGGQTNSRLAELTGETEETVSRKLKRLRRHGISAFRRDGRITTNYLTPLGRALADISSEPSPQEAAQQSEAAESRLIKQVLVRQMEARVQPDPHLRDLAILGADAENSDAPRCAYGR